MSKTICISQQDDGTFSVYEEKAEGMEAMPGMDAAPSMAPDGQAPASPDMAGMEAQEANQGQTAKTLDEAMMLAKSMFDEGGEGGMSVEQAFQGGFEGKSAMGA